MLILITGYPPHLSRPAGALVLPRRDLDLLNLENWLRERRSEAVDGLKILCTSLDLDELPAAAIQLSDIVLDCVKARSSFTVVVVPPRNTGTVSGRTSVMEPRPQNIPIRQEPKTGTLERARALVWSNWTDPSKSSSFREPKDVLHLLRKLFTPGRT